MGLKPKRGVSAATRYLLDLLARADAQLAEDEARRAECEADEAEQAYAETIWFAATHKTSTVNFESN
jgi:hypothetical protein